MITNNVMSFAIGDDADLVAESLSGNRDAFGRIVSRYQSLICSLAYSATGNLGQSEDLAQETFITAWKHLRHLRERHKLRAWLCGIARNRINNSLRREGREPVHRAESLEAAQETASVEPLPADHTISKEEEAILWRALERVPEVYREPLVLFYREHQSVEDVATALDLSDDAVKQRLSRGRKLLAEEVASFVEGALAKTNPGHAFTVAVLTSLPLLTASAQAATIAAAAVKSGTAKAAASFGFFNAIISPVLGFVGPWFQYRVFRAAAQTESERRNVERFYRGLFALMGGFAIVLGALVLFGRKFAESHPLALALGLIGLVLAYLVGAIRLGTTANTMFRKLRDERTALPDAAEIDRGWEYRSRIELLGLPLIHLRFRSRSGERGPVKAWIAGGDYAVGVLLAFGGIAIAPVSAGGLAVGLMPLGGVAAGIFAAGGFALGAWVFGGFAFGWQAFGGCAFAWHAAQGGIAMAREFAVGGIAFAAQANTEIAKQFVQASSFFRKMEFVTHYAGWLNLLWLIPVWSWWRILVTKKNQNSAPR